MRRVVRNSTTFLSFIVGRVGDVVMLFGAIFIIVVLFIPDGLVGVGRPSVENNVMIGAFLRTRRTREARVTAHDVIAFLGLYQFANRPAHTLIPDVRKRLELAYALATGPRLFPPSNKVLKPLCTWDVSMSQILK